MWDFRTYSENVINMSAATVNMVSSIIELSPIVRDKKVFFTTNADKWNE